ncbi:LLM class flavin-dependent oxidoreductase [Epidermidibacterium keratini]|uniref:LLM class flavin-dependent oxidoreductase n=1 Tax=Epidermidibacterium keratini TaxID=1891644 RepID=A0A7L4YLR5_9ACTN|nr:LLM class flavin-dependent oxidoreductase [Epidermidibacterium keratini]QHC00211.1 LLM class flavin-dependent oxidoreductase [Epidermidibacterium keratini]
MALGTGPLFSLGLPLPLDRSGNLDTLAVTAERLGYDLFSLTDHPYGESAPEAYAALAYLLGRTTTISGYVGVTNLPLRPAPMLARTLSTLTALSGNRVVLGLGSGGFPDAIARMGVERLSPKQAVDAFEEAIVLIHELSGGGGRVSHREGHYQVTAIAPSAEPAPPIWTGSGGPRALAITGRLADGWIPPQGAGWDSTTYRDGIAIITDAAHAAGRDLSTFTTMFNVNGVLSASDLPSTRNPEGRWVGGSARQWVDQLTQALALPGRIGFNGAVTDESGAMSLELLDQFADEVMAPVRAAAPAAG